MDPQTVKLAVLGLYMVILMVIGVVASRRMKDLGDYFAGGKKLGFWAAAFSSRATGESSWLLLGLTGMGAVVGVKAFWVVAGETLGVAVAWLLMAGRFKRLTDLYDSVTVPDYLESRFRDTSHRLRQVAAGTLVIFVTIYVSAQIDATGQAFNEFLGWNYFVGALVGFGVVMVYITSGGFLAVVWSDVFQGTLMFLGLVILPIAGLLKIGGWSAMTATLAAQDPSLLHPMGKAGWSLAAVPEMLAFALIGLGFLGSPQIFVRYLALNSQKEIKPGATVAIIWTVLADGGAVLTGMVGRALYCQGDPEAFFGTGAKGVLPYMVDHLFPVVIVGIYVAVVLSAIMSTIDSLLVVAGSAAVRDYYQKVFRPEMKDDELVATSRNLTVALAVAALILAMSVAVVVPERTIFWFVIFGWSGISATFCPVMILSLFWPRMTSQGAIAGMITGFVCVPIFKFVAPKLAVVGPFFDKLSELPPAFLFAGLAVVLVSLGDSAGQQNVSDIASELSDGG
ncbi:MAG: sodium/proline symporter [Candidatus Eremiobacteraeota bacterium]|nr:sodium/proline symporter [Candidatus Eremiobacteraeota bacterium]